MSYAAFLPTVAIEVNTTGTTWVDIACYCRSFSTYYGRSRQTDQFTPGSATIVLDNSDDRFHPANTAGPYGANFQPGRLVRIIATWNAVAYPIFYGTMGDPSHSLSATALSAEVTVPLIDVMAMLAANERVAVVEEGAEERTGARITRILTDAGWPYGSTADTGLAFCTATTLEGNALAEIERVAVAEGGSFWVKADGSARFANRAAPLGYALAATFGIASPDLDYQDPEVSYELAAIANTVTAGSVTGDTVALTDGTSAAYPPTGYGPRTYAAPTDLPLLTVFDLHSMADLQLAIRKDAAYRVHGLTVVPSTDATNLFPVALAAALWNRYRVKLTLPGGTSLDQYGFCGSVEHQVDMRDLTWRTRLGLEPSTAWDGFDGNVWDTAVWDTDVWFF